MKSSEYKKRWVGLWPTANTVKFLKRHGAEMDDLHLTCYYSNQESNLFEFDSKCMVRGMIYAVEYWEDADVYVARVELADDISRKISRTFEDLYGKQEFEHNPHITLAKGGQYKMSYKSMVGCTVAFDRFGVSQPSKD